VGILSQSRTDDGVVAPTLDDRVAQAGSGVVGGPIGRLARGGRGWWTPMRVVLALATICFGLGVVQKSACVVSVSSQAASPLPYSHMCYSDMQFLYVGRGLAEGLLPYQPISDLATERQPVTEEEREDLMLEYPVLTGAWMGVASFVTHALGKAPDLSTTPRDAIGSDVRVQSDSALFWGVNAIGFFAVLLIGLAFLVRAQPRRPWDAAMVAAAPVVALTATINWDLLAFGCVGGIIWAWATRRPVLAGVFIGLGAATKLYPLFFLGPIVVLCLRERQYAAAARTVVAAVVAWAAVNVPIYLWSPDAWTWFWRFNAGRGPDFGSIWLAVAEYGHRATPAVVNLTTWIVFGVACLAIAALALLAPRRPRLPQLLFLVVVAFLVVNKVYSPQYVLWLLPLAVLARPRWRDLLIWQACETFYFFAVWMHIANFIAPPEDIDWVYVLAIAVRVAGQLFLVFLVVRDILQPWRDPVRSDGLSDDPVGGILDEGVDAEPFPPGGGRHRQPVGVS